MNARLLVFLPLLAVPACVETTSELLHAVCSPVAALPDSAFTGRAHLWDLDPAPPLSAEQQQRLVSIWTRRATADLHVARLSVSADSALQLGAAVVVTVSPGRSVVAVGDQFTRRGPNDLSWSGPLENQLGRVTLVLTTLGVTGSLQSGNAAYHFEPIGGGLQALTCIDASMYGPD